MTTKTRITALEESLNKIKNDVIEHMNNDHAETNLTYARVLARMPDAGSARITDFDQFGISLLAEASNGTSQVQISFLEPLQKTEDIRPALIKLLDYARDSLNISCKEPNS
jgi:putative heme iron utilization protein